MNTSRVALVIGLAMTILLGCRGALRHLPDAALDGPGGGPHLEGGTRDLVADADARGDADAGAVERADVGAEQPSQDASGSDTAQDRGPASISGAPQMMNFDRVEIDVQTTPRTWTITNNRASSTGTLTLAVDNAGEIIVVNNCTAPLASGDQCTISVAVKASGGGSRSGMLTLTAAQGGTATLPVAASAGYRLTVTPVGTGTVTSIPAGVSCGSTCSTVFDPGTAVTLQARTTNGSGFFFSGWSGGGCSGPFRDCAITLNASATVTATFSAMTNNLIFVTSGTFMTNEGSAANYDKDCNLAATAAGINDASSTSYVALTSDAASTAASRLGSARGWVRMDGKPFADTQSGLFASNQVFNSIRFNELGRRAAAQAMTGTNPDGTANSTNCQNFTVLTNDSILCGNAEGGPGRWTDIGASCYLGCGGPYPVVCMGKAKAAQVTPVRNAGRAIWLDAALYFTPAPGATVTPPDQVCQAERPAGVTTAVALLAYANNSSKGPSVALSASMNYVRVDGTLVGTGMQLLSTATLESGIWQNANGSYRTGGGPAGVAFTGGAAGSLANTCNDWTGSNDNGITGDYGLTVGPAWWTAGSGGCGSPPVFFYCVQTVP